MHTTPPHPSRTQRGQGLSSTYPRTTLDPEKNNKVASNNGIIMEGKVVAALNKGNSGFS